MTCNYSKRQLENGSVSMSCTVITFLTAELLPKLEVLGFKSCRLYLYRKLCEYIFELLLSFIVYCFVCVGTPGTSGSTIQ